MHYAFTLRSQLEELARALDHIEDLLLQQAAERELVSEMRLIAEEGLANIVRHAYEPDEEGEIEVVLVLSETEVRLELRDQGRPFNPLEHPEPDLEAPIEDRPLGGLGVHLIRSLTDTQTYTRQGEVNVLVLIKRRGV
jgi:anti-sigma regulatory factor (Ser/Thr protein kinase)